MEVRPALEFGYEPGKNKLLSICIDADREPHIAFLTPGDADMNEPDLDGNVLGYNGRKGKLLHLSSMVDLESRLSVGCAGAVLTCLQRRKAVNHLIISADDASSIFKISAISMFSLDRTMYAGTAERTYLNRVLMQEGGSMPTR